MTIVRRPRKGQQVTLADIRKALKIYLRKVSLISSSDTLEGKLSIHKYRVSLMSLLAEEMLPTSSAYVR